MVRPFCVSCGRGGYFSVLKLFQYLFFDSFDHSVKVRSIVQSEHKNLRLQRDPAVENYVCLSTLKASRKHVWTACFACVDEQFLFDDAHPKRSAVTNSVCLLFRIHHRKLQQEASPNHSFILLVIAFTKKS